MNIDMARNDFPVTHNNFRRKYDVKAVSRRVQVLPLLYQHHNVALRYS